MFSKSLTVFAMGMALTLSAATSASAQSGGGKYVSQQGFQISQVYPGTASDQGMEPGDIIVSVNGFTVRSGNDLRYRLGQVGGVANLQVIDCRTGRVNQITVYPVGGKIGVDGYTVTLSDGGGSNSPYGGGYGGTRPVPVRPNRLPGR